MGTLFKGEHFSREDIWRYMDTWNQFYFFRIVHTIAKIYPCIAKSLLNKKGTNHHNQNQGETQRYKGEIFSFSSKGSRIIMIQEKRRDTK